MKQDKNLPHNVIAEDAVLGAALNTPELALKVTTGLMDTEFFNHAIL